MLLGHPALEFLLAINFQIFAYVEGCEESTKSHSSIDPIWNTKSKIYEIVFIKSIDCWLSLAGVCVCCIVTLWYITIHYNNMDTYNNHTHPPNTTR